MQSFLGTKTFIIAEAGVNHNGDIGRAIEMVDAASTAGADAIKFQTFVPEEVALPDTKTASYQKQNTGDDTQLNMIKSFPPVKSQMAPCCSTPPEAACPS